MLKMTHDKQMYFWKRQLNKHAIAVRLSKGKHFKRRSSLIQMETQPCDACETSHSPRRTECVVAEFCELAI